MDYVSKINDLYLEGDDSSAFGISDSSKLVALYLYYHYFNADNTKLSDVTGCLINTFNDKSFEIKSILSSCTIDEAVDFITVLDEDKYYNTSNEELLLEIKDIAKTLGKLYYHEQDIHLIEEQKAYDELDIKVHDNTTFVINVLCGFSVSIEEKINLQKMVSELSVKNNNVFFGIIFEDDIEQEIADIDNPKECVARGTLNLISDDFCTFGSEKSLITLISAKSLKQLFYQYSTRGLFASNLRFYVTAKKIDQKIIDTIQNDSESFCYLNNGIVITCEDYSIVNKQIIFNNFSIVNGGQTTNLVGRTFFENDFGIICKVIKSKFEDKNENIEFLSKVAEASNTQKPIKAKDLIANRPEQRKLKIQFAEAGMFLKVKRGEKIDKQQYPEAYMNATNEEIAQLLYSCVYQSPGSAKNSSSSLLSNDKTYDLIFKNEYSNDFLKSIQYLKVAYSDWKKKISKSEQKTSVKYGLSKHANFIVIAMIGFIMKTIVNDSIKMDILTTNVWDINYQNDEFKKMIKCNDIGKISLIKPDIFPQIGKSTFKKVIDYLVENILSKAYANYKKYYPTYAYSQFAKSDKYYYQYILPVLKDALVKDQKTIFDLFGESFNLDGQSDVKPDTETNVDDLEGMEEELIAYRNKIHELDPNVKVYQVVKNAQIALIIQYFPRNKYDLKNKIKMNDDQIRLYGQNILDIVSKYIRMEDFA